MTSPILVSIPLQPRTDEAQWAIVAALLSRTLRSLFAQTDPDFAVLIAGHEKPDIPELADPRIAWLAAKHVRTGDIRPDKGEVMRGVVDKVFKRRMTMREMAKRGGGLVLMLDADDLVRRDLFATVRSLDQHIDTGGYLITSGFVLDAQTTALAPVGDVFAGKAFWNVCGSCALIRFTAEDFESGYTSQFRKHNDWPIIAAAAGRALTPLKAPFGVYTLNTEVNESNRFRKDRRIEAVMRSVAAHSVGGSVLADFGVR